MCFFFVFFLCVDDIDTQCSSCNQFRLFYKQLPTRITIESSLTIESSRRCMHDMDSVFFYVASSDYMSHKLQWHLTFVQPSAALSGLGWVKCCHGSILQFLAGYISRDESYLVCLCHLTWVVLCFFLSEQDNIFAYAMLILVTTYGIAWVDHMTTCCCTLSW